VPPPWAGCKNRSRVLSSVVKLADTVARHCPAVNTNTVFPGACVGAPDFVACVDEQVECRVCQILNQNDGLSIDCDTFDDGQSNGSCPNAPGVSTTTTVPTTLGTTTTTSTTTTTVVAAVCGNNSVEGGEQCDDGNTSAGDCCSPSCQYDALGAACTTDANACTDDVCDGAGACQHTNNADPCNDGLFCNGADTCSGGSCAGHAGNPCPGADGDGDCSETCDEVADACTANDPVGFGCDDGSCLPCGDGQRCISPLGCESGVCSGGSLTMPPPWATCQPASCTDGIQNGGETDVDCGGATICPRCQAGDSCFAGSDCTSSVCSSGLCQAPTCSDGVLNGSETDIDCGGSCPDCLPGDSCLAGSDCTSGICSGGLCTTPTCSDGVKNQGEGDVDCGGPCADCALGKTCNTGGDCQTGSCNGGICKCPSHLFTFSITSNSGGVFDSAEWPGGNASQSIPGGCGVTIKRPGDNIDLVCSLGGGGFAVIGSSGFSSCFGTGGEDGDGCQADSCPPAGVPSCCATRPSCSAALNGSGSARYFVQCNP